MLAHARAANVRERARDASRSWLTGATRCALLVGVFALGCGSGPPPSPDMRAFSAQRTGPEADAVAAEYPLLAEAADAAMRRAQEAHADGDVAERVRQVRLADIYWRTAVAQHSQIGVDADRSRVDADLRAAKAELAELIAEREKLAAEVAHSDAANPSTTPLPVVRVAPAAQPIDALAGALLPLGPPIIMEGEVTMSFNALFDKGQTA
ncbi:MAG: hypothetical protein KC620_24950, partial [Myxococcales bacterium]|nr:hypothetical protein [Myxococcales bacterium]